MIFIAPGNRESDCPEIANFDTVSEDEVSKSAIRKAVGERVPNTESGTVVPFPGSQGDDAAFIAGVRSSGAAAYRDVVARLQSTGLQSTDDDSEGAADKAPAKRRQAPRKAVGNEDRRQYLTEPEVEQLCDAARKRGRYGHRDATSHAPRDCTLTRSKWRCRLRGEAVPH
jgi:hypothetical protein